VGKRGSDANFQNKLHFSLNMSFRLQEAKCLPSGQQRHPFFCPQPRAAMEKTATG